MGEILKAAGCTYNNGELSRCGCSRLQSFMSKLFQYFDSLCSVVKTTVLLADINDFNRVNEVYRTCEFPPFIGMFRYCYVTLTISQFFFLTFWRFVRIKNIRLGSFHWFYFIWVKTNYSSGESRGIPRPTEKYSPLVLFVVIVAAVEPSELEMDTTMKGA